MRAGALRPKQWKEVTMVSMDIVSFTEHSAKLTATAVSVLLGGLYFDVDRLAAEYGVDKIDIVGDAYIAVCNCPNNAMAFSLACIALAEDTLWDADNPALGCLKLRSAVHTGKVTGLVLDSAPFKYTLVGDTVVTVKFLETSSEPGSVSCSAATAKILDANQFSVVKRPDNPEVFSVLWAGDIHDTIVIASNLQFLQVTDQFLNMFEFTRKQLVSMRGMFGPRTRVEAIQTAIEQCIQFTFPTSTAVVLYTRSGVAMCVAMGFVQDLTQSEGCVVVTCHQLPDNKAATASKVPNKEMPVLHKTKTVENMFDDRVLLEKLVGGMSLGV